MCDTSFVRSGEAVGNSRQQFQYLSPGALLRHRPILERAAIDEFSDDVLPAFVLSDIVDRKDVRVIQGRCQLRFALKPATCRGVSKGIRQELDRHGSIELGIQRSIYLTHTAQAYKGDDSVVA